METVGELSVGDQWSSFGGMFSSEEADFMVHLLDDSVPSEQCGGLNFETTSRNWPSMNTMGFDHNFYFCPESTNYCFPKGSSNSSVDSVVVHHTVDHQNYNLTNCSSMFVSDNGLTPMDYLMVNEPNMTFDILAGNVMENTASLNKEMSVGVMEESDALAFDAIVLPEQKLQPKRKLEIAEPDIGSETKKKVKKARVSESVQRKRKNVQSKKKPMLDEIGNYHEKVNTADLNTQSSSSCSSEDDTNVTNEHNDGLTLSPNGDKDLNSNVKTRASRGSATDPQSLYARKRRERINERLRMLQNLVPNGTKVDISTMLEEAVQYVKFLELQIKLLSSDDLWMYAPLAYNGMDIGLDLKIFLP